MKLIVGLGNPGRAYASNRHNIGIICLNHFARGHGISLDRKMGQSRTGTGDIAGEKAVLARPQTYMNTSGGPVSYLVRRLDITLDNLVVIHDDLDLPLGRIRIRKGGSSGGHKGINSIIEHLGSRDFYRVRVGIGRPEEPSSDREARVISHVLGDFAPDEKETVARVISRVSEALDCLLSEGLAAAMNRFN
ncbi:MAG: aminoacyl-tRNA hydrolase [Chloroflexi bacterium]|nr:aminoacyl-tRNA hydrolase [Chloroflexota bacterium]